MIKRNLEQLCFSEEFGDQMRFIAGPRQAGKTTLVTTFLKSLSLSAHYHNWDYRETRIAHQENPDWYAESILDRDQRTWMAFDEIHKYPHWKDVLKEAYDKHKEFLTYIVTGSARLDFFRKAGDSLAGRYFLFRLFPLVLNELSKQNNPHKDSIADPLSFIKKRLKNKRYADNEMLSLLKFSGFPDPFLKGTELFQRKWKNDYLDRLLYDDISQLAQVKELENISKLFLILPSKIASPLSTNSLTRDLSVSYNAVKNYLYLLELCYIIFMIPPYSKNIARSLTKERKCYLFDWTHISDEGARFENYIAVELVALLATWRDLGYQFQLNYIRTKEGKESDFLITKDHEPWLLIEVKLAKQTIAAHHFRYAHELGDIPVLQLIKETGVAERYENNSFQVSASRFLA